MAQATLLAVLTIVTLATCDVTSHHSTLMDRLGLIEEQLSYQNDVIQNQGIRLYDLDNKYRRLQSTLYQQEAKLSQQDARLSEQEKIIRQQNSRLLQQEQIITKLLASDFTRATPVKSTTPQSLHVYESESSVTSTHDVIARSDDRGYLGVVVNEMNQRVTKMSADIQALKNTDIKHDSDIQNHGSDIQALKNLEQVLNASKQHQDQAIRDARSSSFVRWGSSHCPHNSSLVYSGIVGGSYYDHSGAAVNYLCLTMSPVFGYDRSLSEIALLYGGEYQTYDSNHNSEPMCAVCRASFSTTIMIPGTNVCTSGWTPLYSGYLMAGLYGDAAGSEFVCVDVGLESRAGTGHNENGKLFYFTKTRCGSLPCGPYVNDKVVTCVVCGQ